MSDHEDLLEHPAHFLGSRVTAPQSVGCTWASAFYKAVGVEVTLCVGASGSVQREAK